MNSMRHWIVPATVIVMIALGGCATKKSPEASFYRLTALETERGKPLEQGLIVGVGPIQLPDYIDRAQLVTQIRSNQLSVDEYNRWAGNLEQNMATVLAENLSYRLATDAVMVHPWGQAVKVDYQVVLNVRRFDLGEDGQVHLVAQWRVLVDDGRQLSTIRRLELIRPVAGDDHNAIVSAQSRALLELGRVISDSIDAG